MKIDLTILAVSLAAMTATASASHIYKGLAEGNSDLTAPHPWTDARSPDAGESAFDFHQGLASPDLSPPPRRADTTAQRDTGFDFHHGLESPDLSPPPHR